MARSGLTGVNGRPANNQENRPEPVEPVDLGRGGIIQSTMPTPCGGSSPSWLDEVGYVKCMFDGATANAAEKAGKRDSMGTITVGEAADAILFDADPLTDITHLAAAHHRRAVISAGHLVHR